MIEQLGRHHRHILDAVAGIDSQFATMLSTVGEWGDDLRERIAGFVERGKMIRGSLVAAACEGFGVAPEPETYTVAASLELIQAFLLIHDDIMDEDSVRRGAPSLSEQYRLHAEENGLRRPNRFAESMAICAGDTVAMLALSAVTRLRLPPRRTTLVTRLIADELVRVSVAQMTDVASGHTSTPVSEEAIVNLYRYKTGRYTFSLPLMVGAALAGASEQARIRIGEWGELQGVVFQIRDDLLEVTRSAAWTGKPAASDIVANKQTLYRAILTRRASGTEFEDLIPLFGSDSVSSEDLDRFHRAIEETGTLSEVEGRVDALRGQASALIDEIDGLTAEGRETLEAIDRYNASRER
jgi:geranylgeranyl diphosphate synthase type I